VESGQSKAIINMLGTMTPYPVPSDDATTSADTSTGKVFNIIKSLKGVIFPSQFNITVVKLIFKRSISMICNLSRKILITFSEGNKLF